MLKGISDEKAAWQHLAPLSHQLCSGLLMLAISCLDCYLKKEKTKCPECWFYSASGKQQNFWKSRPGESPLQFHNGYE